MLGSHDFRFEDPVKAIKELDGLCATMWKYGMVSDFVLGSIYQVFGRLHDKELKKIIKQQGAERLGIDLYPGDLIDSIKDKDSFVIDFRNTLTCVLNHEGFLVEDAQINAIVSEVKSLRQ
jgi:hypothetical protein